MDRSIIEHSADQQQDWIDLKDILEKSNDQGRPDGQERHEKSRVLYNFSKSRKRFRSSLRSSQMHMIIVVSFLILSAVIGVVIVCLTAPKPNKKCELKFKRIMNSSLISSSQPHSIAVGDFNNDQQIDIVVANSGDNTIGIFLVQTNQTFAKQKTYDTGSDSSPYSVAVDDFDRDNNLDVALANYGRNSIEIFLGNGNGTFKVQREFFLGNSRPLFLTVDDFNNDHRTDICVVNYGTNSIGLLLGYGNGSFEEQKNFVLAFDSIPQSLAVGDFNNDTYLDVAIANFGTNNVVILLGNGRGTFVHRQTYTTLHQSNPTSIIVTDFNKDSQLDVAVANSGTHCIGVFLGYGNGTFRPQIIYSTGDNSFPQYINVGEFDEDNTTDLVVIDAQNNQVHILPGRGDGSFRAIVTYYGVSQSQPFSLAISDFDNDNRSDLAVINYGTNNVLILANYSMESAARTTNYFIGSSRRIGSLAINDFNKDHIPDIVFWGDGSIIILNGLDDGTFDKKSMQTVTIEIDSSYICVDDLNNDTHLDIVFANEFSNSVDILLGRDDGMFNNVTSYTAGEESNPYWLALGDLNDDQRLDIVSLNSGTKTIGIFIGNGDGTFAEMITLSAINSTVPNVVDVRDLNNDTYLDLIVADDNGFIIIFRGHGNGTFSFLTECFTGESSSLVSIAFADINSDNHLDMIVANWAGGNVGVFLGFGNGTFGIQTTFSALPAFAPFCILIVDINDDDIYDIVASNMNNDEVVIFCGYGNGSFELYTRYPTGYGTSPKMLAVAHFDRRKQLELVVTLWGTGDLIVINPYNAAKFAQQTKYPTGSAPKPVSIAIGDLNNDNHPDIAVANSGNDSLTILFNLNNDTFTTKMFYSDDSIFSPRSVLICDVNGDNQSDIITVNSNMNTISIIRGHGNENFAEQWMYSTGDRSYPYAVATGDFNNDHRLDLVIANQDTKNVGIFFGFDYVSFRRHEAYSSYDGQGAIGTDIGDFDEDGIADIAVIFGDSSNLGILLGYGNGSFATMNMYSTGKNSTPHCIAVDDFDHDGHTDLVTCNTGTDQIGILLGYGNGSFASVIVYSTGGLQPSGLAIGDINNDNHSDIVVANYVTDNVGILLGSGDGTFSNAKTLSTSEGSGPMSVALGDFNNDGHLDMVVANYWIDKIGFFFGNGNGTFQEQVTFSTGQTSMPYYVATGDFNQDNNIDVAVVHRNADEIGILLMSKDGVVTKRTGYLTGSFSTPTYVSISDFNRDKNLDIAVVTYGTNGIVILFGHGNGGFLLGKPISTGAASQPNALAIGDFNGDMQLDLAVVSNIANEIVVYLAHDSEPFGSVELHNIDRISKSRAIATGDFNNNGLTDIVVANFGSDNITVLLDYVYKGFEQISYSTGNGSAPSSVAVADFNNDTYLDIVVANSGTDDLVIFVGYGTGQFEYVRNYSIGIRADPSAVIAEDFNNDGIPDIVVANYGTSNIFLLYGRGDGTFENEFSYSLGYDYRPYAIAVNDLDANGWMDIAIACYNTDHIEILMKIC